MSHPAPTGPRPPFPTQPLGVPWPTDEWPVATLEEVGADGARATALLDELVGPDPHPVFGPTFAAAVVVGGRLVAERYGRRVVQDLRGLGDDPPFDQLDASSELLSWSMAKSLTSLAVGIAAADGRLDVADPVPEPQWQAADDPRRAITWHHLLTMRPGLRWTEAYELDAPVMPDVITMLFGEGADDAAAFAASFPLVAEPGSDAAYTYSSGTTNIVAANLQRVLGVDAAGMERFLRDRLLDPIGMTSARLQFDAAGTFLGSSYVHAPLREWCRFGLLAARGGRWGDRQLVPAAWLDDARIARSWEEDLLFHGAHWWAWDRPGSPWGAHGFEGQRIISFPERDVIVVRFGRTESDNTVHLNAHLAELAACFPVTS